MEGVGAIYFWPFCENARTAFCEMRSARECWEERGGAGCRMTVAPERGQYQARLQHHLRSQLQMFFLSMRESLNGLK